MAPLNSSHRSCGSHRQLCVPERSTRGRTLPDTSLHCHGHPSSGSLQLIRLLETGSRTTGLAMRVRRQRVEPRMVRSPDTRVGAGCLRPYVLHLPRRRLRLGIVGHGIASPALSCRCLLFLTDQLPGLWRRPRAVRVAPAATRASFCRLRGRCRWRSRRWRDLRPQELVDNANEDDGDHDDEELAPVVRRCPACVAHCSAKPLRRVGARSDP